MNNKIFAAVITATLTSAGSIFAAGADTNGSGTQDYSFILDNGNSFSVTRTTSDPKITASYPDGSEITDAFKSINITTMEAKWDYGDITLGIRSGRPYGADLTYNDGFLTNTHANINSSEIGVVAARSINKNVKVFGGLRMNSFKGKVNKPYLTTGGGTGAGYTYELENTSNTGFTVGAAYEIPEIYLRASIQFNSEIKHNGTKNVETLDGGAATTTLLDMTAPSSTIIKLRSAVTEKIVLFANWRSSTWSKFVISADTHKTTLGQGDLWDPDSGVDYTIGGAVVLSDRLTGLVGMSRSPKDPDSTSESALSPFNGSSTTFLGATFKVADNLEVTGAVANVTLGDTNVLTPTGAAPFTKNTAQRVTIGTKISF
jgi:hypothetical protein